MHHLQIAEGNRKEEMLTRKGGVVARLARGELPEKKVQEHRSQTVDGETISVTASVTSGGHSKEGMKGVILGLSKMNGLLLEQNEALNNRVKELEQDLRGRNMGDVKAKKKEITFHCDEEACRMAFALRKDLDRHISTVHLKKKYLICGEEGCGKKFGRNFTLERHRRGVHLKERPHSCKEGGCGKAFAVKRDLVNHVRGVHLKLRNYICEEEGCEKRFETKSNRERHRRGVHVKERLFHCDDCEKNFSRKDNLKVHIQAAHQSLKQICKEGGCGKAFSTESNLERHAKAEHQ